MKENGFLESFIKFSPSLLVSVIFHVLLLEMLLWAPAEKAASFSKAQRRGTSFVEVGLVNAPAGRDQKIFSSRKAGMKAAGTTKTFLGHLGSAQGSERNGAAGFDAAARASERERYIYALQLLLEQRKTYPKASKDFHETGKVIVQFFIAQDGRIENVSVTGPSTFERLNQAALQLVSGLEKYKPLPENLRAASLKIEVPIEYVLNQ